MTCPNRLLLLLILGRATYAHSHKVSFRFVYLPQRRCSASALNDGGGEGREFHRDEATKKDTQKVKKSYPEHLKEQEEQ